MKFWSAGTAGGSSSSWMVIVLTLREPRVALMGLERVIWKVSSGSSAVSSKSWIVGLASVWLGLKI